jgi:uncharacterized membrane protein
MKPVYLLFRVAKVITLLLFIGLLLYLYFLLPEQIGIHFNQFGQADNYLSRSQFFYTAGLFLIFFNIAISLLGRFLAAMPASLLPVPNRDFWSATPELRIQLNYLLRNWLNGFMALINIVMALTLFVVFKINTDLDASIGNYGWVFIGALAAIAAWVAYLPVRLMMRRAVAGQG